jgi:flavin-binding protein dodecin
MSDSLSLSPTNGYHRAAVSAVAPEPTVEFFGSSDDTIAEAVRHALALAAESLSTLDGVGVRVIPQIAPGDGAPRYRVTLRVTATANGSSHHAP